MALVGYSLSLAPGILKGNTGGPGLHVNPDSVAEDRDFMRYDVLSIGHCSRGEPRLYQGGQESLGIFGGGLDQDVQIERGTGDTMKDRGHAPNNDVSDVMLLKGLEHVLQPVEHGFDPSG
jgi:hypothetical protein